MISITARLTKEQREEIKKKICDAVWAGKVDQVYTREVAEMAGCSTAQAKRILDQIVTMQSGDSRFTKSRVGVYIEDGSQFVRDDAEANAHNAREDTGAAMHNVWFTIGADE